MKLKEDSRKGVRKVEKIWGSGGLWLGGLGRRRFDFAPEAGVANVLDDSVDEAARARDEEFLHAFWRASNGESGDAETDER